MLLLTNKVVAIALASSLASGLAIVNTNSNTLSKISNKNIISLNNQEKNMDTPTPTILDSQTYTPNNLQYKNGKLYCLGTNNKIIKGWVTITFTNDVSIGKFTLEGKKQRFYFGPNGAAVSGIQKIDGKIYFFNVLNFELNYGYQCYNNKFYHFSQAGNATLGWLYNTTYQKYQYFSPTDGSAVTGVQKIDGYLYLFNNDTFNESSGEKFYNGNLYNVSNSDGALYTGWNDSSKGYQYFSPTDGAAVTGIQEINGDSYYFNKDKIMQTGLQTIDGNTYYFYDNGIMAKNTIVYVDGVGMNFGANGVLEG